MKTASLILGILAVCGMFFGFIPCLGALNWFNIPFSMMGLIVSIIAYNKNDNQPKGNAKAGIIMCAIAMLFGIVRLVLGGGIV